MDKLKMGEFLLNQRKNKNLSQENLAEIIGVTFQAVSKWERDEAIPDILTLEKLAKLYNITIDEIISGQKKELPNECNCMKINKDEVDENTLNKDKQSRFLTTVYSSMYFIFFFISCFLPLVNGYITVISYFGDTINAYVELNYFEIIFVGSYKIGNVTLMLHFITQISIFCFSLLIPVFSIKKYILNMFFIRKILIIISIILTIVFYIICMFCITPFGLCLLIMYLILDILYLALPFNRKSYIVR